MKRKPRVFWMLLIMLALLLAGGCRKEQPPAAVTEGKGTATEGKVTATEAYLSHFGPAPTVAEGSAHAMVGYLPKADNPQQLVPLPLYLFSESNRMQLLIERLITVDSQATERIGASNPFPPGLILNTLIRDGELLNVDLIGGPELVEDSQRMQAIQAVLGHSLLQFPGVTRVRLSVNGVFPPGVPDEGVVPDPAVVASAGEPKLIGVVAVWEPGMSQPQEVSVFFDRPLDVNRVEIQDADGRAVEGEQFRSVFDMAVVLLPKHPDRLSEGLPLTVRFDVVDKLGRTAQGEKTMPLVRMEHP